jgi:hypothetical protein
MDNIIYLFLKTNPKKYVDHCWLLMKIRNLIGYNLSMWGKNIDVRVFLQICLKQWQNNVDKMVLKVYNCLYKNKIKKLNLHINLWVYIVIIINLLDMNLFMVTHNQ